MATAGTLEYLISIDNSKVQSGLSKAESKVKGFGDKLSAWTVAKGQMIGRLVERAGASTLNFVKGSIQESRQFDASMSQVAATLGKTVDQMNSEVKSTSVNFGNVTKEFTGNLTEFARFMGQNTKYTASEAADALNYMALAGYDTEKSMRMLPTVLNLASAGNFDLARASDMVTDAQSALGLSIEQTEILVDQMAKTSSKTNTSVEQLGDAMLTIGGTAKMLGSGAIDTTTELSMALGVLADNGIKGSEGGTALRNVLLSLTAPTDKAAKKLKELGIEVFDSEGNMKDLPFILQDINEATKDMTSEERTDFLSEVFNKRDLKSIEALLGTDMSRWEELFTQIGNSNGAAAEMAETQLDNLEGDITKLNSALSEAKLSIADKLTPTLRKFAQKGTQWVQRLTTAFSEDGFSGVAKEAGKIVQEGIDYLKNSDSPVLQKVGKALVFVKDVASTVWNLITDFPGTIERMKESDSPFISGLGIALETVKGIAEEAWNLITDFPGTVERLKESDSPFISGLGSALEWIGETVESVKGLFIDFEGTMKNMKESDNPLLVALERTISFVSDGFTGLIQLINGDWVAAIRTFNDSDSDLLNTVGVIADTFVVAKSRVDDFINSVREAFGASGSSGSLYGAYADKMAKEFGEITSEAERKMWLNDLKAGMQQAGFSSESIGKFSDVLGKQDYSDPASRNWVSYALKELSNPVNVDKNQLIEMWKNASDVKFELPVEPELSEGQAKQVVDEAQKFLDGNQLDLGVRLKLKNFDPSSAAPQGYWNGLPGNAKGNWNVPYDNYLARLHRGEMVLTASQARQYREGSSGIDTGAIVSALQSLRNDLSNLQLVVGRKTFGRAIVNYGGGRMSDYIGGSESRLAAGYGT